MTATGQIQAGSRITAAMLQGIAPLAVIKGADESVNSNTLQFDDALFLPIQANAQYIFDCYLNYEGGAAGSTDLQWTWSVPTGATLRYQPIYTSGSALNVSIGTTVTGATVVVAATNGTGNLRGLSMNGTLIVGSTPGNLSLEWARNAGSTPATIVHAQSYLTLWQVA